MGDIGEGSVNRGQSKGQEFGPRGSFLGPAPIKTEIGPSGGPSDECQGTSGNFS